MITLTPSAINAVRRFIQTSADPVAGLRVSVTGGGCSGMQYAMKLETSAADDDTRFDMDGVVVLVDPLSAPLIDGVNIDFVDSIEGSGFKFSNPNAAKSCACGQSFSAA
ncbi:HesB/IscA family protein [Plasticicumulans acidivorans]|uniref:Iron-sulfur cluster assembly protein n=1 Tax=Plasticicumulans acidivorans TaxID=886464 RepID=A0A317MQY6_9GAMM|nr:iron-sulfur cluster assembly accessory protein [Plasticicumulans acidivorans]PWV58605.1 iron-sulfur cluster assembly protein [Plasticicumulans acidivorans]